MRIALALALAAVVAAGCDSDGDPAAPPPCTVCYATVHLPIAGLSKVETSPEVPTSVSLLPNPGLVDGDLVASTAVDLGYGSGSSALTDLGLEFVGQPSVNELVVWMDRALPREVASLFEWSAYRSDDNSTWTPVALAAAPAQCSDTSIRVAVPSTASRYLKLVTKPLPAGVADPALALVFVTELEARVVVPCSSPP
jgi:hypothetical protein